MKTAFSDQRIRLARALAVERRVLATHQYTARHAEALAAECLDRILRIRRRDLALEKAQKLEKGGVV